MQECNREGIQSVLCGGKVGATLWACRVHSIPPQYHVPHHVPKGAHDSYSNLRTSALDNIVSNLSNIERWKKLFVLLKCILANPPSG